MSVDDRRSICAANAFGEALLYYRRRIGMTQHRLSFLMGGSTPECVSRYERGDREPRLSTVLVAAEALGVSPRALVPHSPDDDCGRCWEESIVLVLTTQASFTADEAFQMLRVLKTLASELVRIQAG